MTRHHPRARRINQILSAAGLTSRRKADTWILDGRVTVNGRVVRQLGSRAVWGEDRIQVDGKDLPAPPQKIYLMLNKPFGYIASLEDPEGRPVVTELIKDIKARIYPVGRLDFDSLGLLLMTNDGEWAYRLTHPRYQVPRTYKITVRGSVSHEALRALQKGVMLEDGPSGPARVSLITAQPQKSLLRMTIAQGRSRQVRRMLETVGYEVIHLIRIGYGSLELGTLKVGHYRHLEPAEVEALKRFVGLKP
ncbi:MAG: rRNA pseudouridine synthase [Deltaproteobacteria bacterium]|nr:rRNA pseudouridine synthase [Deltaproteobacteria bacterium]